MPFKNEHSCRLFSPTRCQKKQYARIKTGSYERILCRPKGKTTTKTQAIRYPKSIWSADRARTHCHEKGGKFHQARKG